MMYQKPHCPIKKEQKQKRSRTEPDSKPDTKTDTEPEPGADMPSFGNIV